MIIKSKNKFLIKFIKPEYKNITIVSCLEIITILISVAIPYFLGLMITSLEQNFATTKILFQNFIIVVSLYLIWDLINIIIDIKFSNINKNIQNNIRMFCYTEIFNSSMVLIQSKNEGEIINKLLKDTERLEKAFLSLFKLVISSLHIIIVFIAMYIINKELTLILISFFVILMIIQRFFSSRLKSGYSKYKASEENLFKDLKSFLSGFINIKIFSLENKCILLLKEKNEEIFKSYINLSKITSFYSNISFFVISLFRISSILIGGCIYLIYNNISIGEIFSVYSYAIQLTTQFRSIIEIDIILKDVETSLDRIYNFINQFDGFTNENNIEININSISSKNLSFKYLDKYIFKDINFYFNKNDIVSITGKNGSGKTSLMNIICGFYKSSQLYLNDIAQSEFTEKEILNRISYVPQNIFLFPVSIMDNISCFGYKSESEVYEVCKSLGIHGKILSLKDGYATIIDDRNSNLSGGEKQIICIARALIKDCDILILDEINSSLDKMLEDNIIKNIEKYYNNKIVFIISHKSKILECCNKSINIDQFKD